MRINPKYARRARFGSLPSPCGIGNEGEGKRRHGFPSSPHPIPRQPLPALLYLLHPCSRLPQGEGEEVR